MVSMTWSNLNKILRWGWGDACLTSWSKEHGGEALQRDTCSYKDVSIHGKFEFKLIKIV